MKSKAETRKLRKRAIKLQNNSKRRISFPEALREVTKDVSDDVQN